MTTTRRKSYVAKPDFQIKLTIIFMLMVTIVANLVGGLCYLLISDKVQRILEDNPTLYSEITMTEIARFLIPKILLAEGISLCVVFILSILVTHTIAGPVFRLERVAREIGRGNLAVKTTLRPKDELKELAAAFNAMCEGLSERIRKIRDEAEILEKACPSKVDFSHLNRLLQEFRLPGDVEPDEVADAAPKDDEGLFEDDEATVDELEDDEA